VSTQRKQFRVVQPIQPGGEGSETYWRRIGTAWEHPGKAGKPPCITGRLDSVPLNGDFVLFEDTGEGKGTPE
jgi:DsbC/DsbD-like thiol-disulfide interchange protein